jgi:tRNA nucleotidyltransferase/poly(A) polymerase
MKIRIVVDFNVDKTDSEELDMDVIRTQAQECLRTHVENMMSNDIEDDLTEVTERDFTMSAYCSRARISSVIVP